MTDRIIHAAHSEDPKGLAWVLFDTVRVLRGLATEDKNSVLQRWIETHGRPETLVTHSGIYSPAELVATITDHKLGDGRKAVDS